MADNIINKTNKKQLAGSKKICQNLLCKARGLMFTKQRKDFGLIFPFPKERSIPLTMIFVFYPIDVLWLDKSKKVVEVRTLQPFIPNYNPKKKAMYVIELPVGTINKTNTKLNDKIEF